MIIKNAKVFTEDNNFNVQDIFIEGEHFTNDTTAGEVIDASELYAIPGLTDVHFHGCVGYDFCDGTPQAIRAISAYQGRNGVTQICPATMTLAKEELVEIAKNARAFKNDEGAILCGINMEGPFLSLAKKGAQNGEYIHVPDFDMYRTIQDASGGLIKLVDIAVEEPGAMEFIDEVKDEVVISIAHTAANYEEAKEAFAHGAKHVTHLYNAMTGFTHREPGVVGAAADDAVCKAELICDGVHIHPAVVRTTFKMFTDDRIVLISDSMMATGMQDGEYSLGGQAVTVKGNLATLHDGTIAGSATNLLDCVKVAVKEMGIPLESAIKAAAVNSAKAIGIYDQYGSITPGKVANVVLLDKELNLKAVIIKGKVYHQV